MAIKSRWRDQFTQISNQSKFHEQVRDILCAGWWARFKAYQEVPVAEICDYHNNSHRFDWYIPELNLVIELHGIQHYRLTNRGNVGAGKAERAFKAGQQRDRAKREAAEAAGYQYIEISYKSYNKLSEERLKEIVFHE